MYMIRSTLVFFQYTFDRRQAPCTRCRDQEALLPNLAMWALIRTPTAAPAGIHLVAHLAHVTDNDPQLGKAVEQVCAKHFQDVKPNIAVSSPPGRVQADADRLGIYAHERLGHAW